MYKYTNSVNVESLNHRIKTNPEELVELAERNYYQQLREVVTTVNNMECKPHFLLLAGPSASSKTTTANKLKDELIKTGVDARVLSLDDFYIDRDDLPILEDGSIDYETIDTLDLEKLNQCLEELINHRKTDFPVFEFPTGKRSSTKINPVTINENTILIIEGLHALNPKIINGFNKNEFLKLYISPTSDYYEDNKLIISSREIRLMRRIIRDHFHRASPIERTLNMWINVVIAEIESIIPFEKEADMIIDSTIIYEPCIYATHLFSIIGEANLVDDAFKEQIMLLKSTIRKFNILDSKYIPSSTVLHEFLDT